MLRICALAALLVAGCRSGAQTDLVTRELRQQEDQIYAMEDYLSQYQQLLCQVRAENANLKRQLADGGGTESLPAPSHRQDTRPRRQPSRTNGPAMPSPNRPPADERPSLDEDIDIEIIEPDVPPLNMPTSAHEPAKEFEVLPASHSEAIDTHDAARSDAPASNPPTAMAGSSAAPSAPRTKAVRGRSTVPPTAMSVSPAASDSAGGSAAQPTQPTDPSPAPAIAPAADVRLRGMVVANEAGGGPRLQVDVEPLAAQSWPAFIGAMSLMILNDAPADAPPQSIARWDFTADEVQSLLADSPNQQSIRLHLELPADTKATGESQLWVRLMPVTGGKLLAHAPIDLHEPGPFSSPAPAVAPQIEMASTSEQPSSSTSSGDDFLAADGAGFPLAVVDERNHVDGWTIARPGQFVKAPQLREDTSSAWRAASGPLPVVTAAAVSTAADHQFAGDVKGTSAVPSSTRPAIEPATFVASSETASPTPKSDSPVSATTKSATTRSAEQSPPPRIAAAWTPERPTKRLPARPMPRAAAPWSPLR